MLIAIPLNEMNNEDGICPSFGRAPYYLIYETDSKINTFIENTAANSQGGAGIKAAQLLIDRKIDVLITPRCGENAAEALKSAGVHIFKSVGDSVNENIASYLNSDLDFLDHFHGGFHGHHGN
jgi:predicted Fe-Mo cluster-binding NifX family protein